MVNILLEFETCSFRNLLFIVLLVKVFDFPIFSHYKYNNWQAVSLISKTPEGVNFEF